jgi:hypothetical protein
MLLITNNLLSTHTHTRTHPSENAHSMLIALSHSAFSVVINLLQSVTVDCHSRFVAAFACHDVLLLSFMNACRSYQLYVLS